MKKISKSTAFIFAALPLISFAGDQTGPITDIRVSSRTIGGNPTHVMLSGAWNSRPTCATNGWWAIDTDTTYGKNVLATLLTAKASGKSVVIWGSGQCTLRSDMEDLVQVGFP